jgi:glycosyltransferase involved in cell wall biosynthesis
MPFRCRVVALHGFLDETQYRQLIEVSDYYVNASKGEGLCLPLMEFLCCGRPAIAPMHTAMADYLRSEYCFPVASSPESDCWPHDPVGRMLTLSRRLNWQSLVEAFRDSYQQARNREQYLAASRAAKAFMKDFCAPEVVAAQIAELIERARQGNAASQAGGSLQA